MSIINCCRIWFSLPPHSMNMNCLGKQMHNENVWFWWLFVMRKTLAAEMFNESKWFLAQRKLKFYAFPWTNLKHNFPFLQWFACSRDVWIVGWLRRIWTRTLMWYDTVLYTLIINRHQETSYEQWVSEWVHIHNRVENHNTREIAYADNDNHIPIYSQAERERNHIRGSDNTL